MKKFICIFTLILLAVVLLFSMSACQELPKEELYAPANALSLWEKIDQTMNSMESMELKSSVEAIFFTKGYEYKLNGNSYMLSTREAHYMEGDSVLTCEGRSYEQASHMVEAYYNGKMYTAVDDGTYDQKLCSVMTHEEYDEIQTSSLTEDIDILDCTSTEFSKREGEGWELRLSGYTKKTIDQLLKSLSLTEDMLGIPVTDMTVSLTADADFRVQKLEIAFSFTVEDEAVMPHFLVTAEYSGFNSAVFDTSKLNAEEYTEVDDVRILQTLNEAMRARMDAVNGKFTLDIKNTYEIQGQTNSAQESDIVTYGRKNGAYCYAISAWMDNQSFVISYQNGEQSVTVGDQTNTATQTEEDAKFFIDSLINSVKYDSNAITDIQKVEEEVYLLTSDYVELGQSMGVSGVEVTSVSQQCKVTFKNNKLMKIEGLISFGGIYDGETVTMATESVVVFDDTNVLA